MSSKKLLSKTYLGFSCLLIALLSTTTVLAQDEHSEGAALVQINRCYTCHNETEPLLGPPYLAIAARHSLKNEVMVEVLSEKIRLGGGGNWGLVPMVPNEHVSESDARKIAQWILNLTP